ncbi:MAG TPA: adenylate/guanylate cyclase domain-containing protein, partial [Patescibacteria group bacterium]|nr:adenylate/guanylate cyclase domain-containing protein [Patescibacteria group bacterium]
WDSRRHTNDWMNPVSVVYIDAILGVQRGRVRESIELARTAGQRARDAGHQKQIWRSSVLLAQALAENDQPDAAAAELPPLSSRVELQDAVYDGTARIRTRLAAGDVEGALQMAKAIVPKACEVGSPADAVAESARSDPAWLREFLDALPVKDEVLASPRLAAARGRLALYEGRLADASRDLREAVEAFEKAGYLLDVWHVGRALAEAEARSGDLRAATARLSAISAAAESAGARLAARLARETGAALGLEVAVPEDVTEAPSRPRVAAGERMVSVLFADVRGYTASSVGRTPAETLDAMAALQRWATQEVGRRHGTVDKFAGDAVMATFNISGQSVDHTVQAVRAALALIDKAALAGVPVGAGVAVGPAVVGSLTDAGNLSVLGEVTNLAARLQTAAGAGDLVLSEEAFRRSGEWLSERNMEAERVELELKGFAETVVAYRLASAAVAPAPA